MCNDTHAVTSFSPYALDILEIATRASVKSLLNPLEVRAGPIIPSQMRDIVLNPMISRKVLDTPVANMGRARLRCL